MAFLFSSLFLPSSASSSATRERPPSLPQVRRAACSRKGRGKVSSKREREDANTVKVLLGCWRRDALSLPPSLLRLSCKAKQASSGSRGAREEREEEEELESPFPLIVFCSSANKRRRKGRKGEKRKSARGISRRRGGGKQCRRCEKRISLCV